MSVELSDASLILQAKEKMRGCGSKVDSTADAPGDAEEGRAETSGGEAGSSGGNRSMGADRLSLKGLMKEVKRLSSVLGKVGGPGSPSGPRSPGHAV